MVYMLCTLQLQPCLLTIASKPSASTNTSTVAKQDPMPPAQNTTHGKESGVTVTSFTPNPIPTSVVQTYVIDAAEIVSASPAYRKMFITEVFKKCNEVEKEARKTASELQKTSPTTSTLKLLQYVAYPNYSHEQVFPLRENIVLEKKINNYAIPATSTSDSKSTPTVTASSISGNTSTTATTTEPAEVSTSQTTQKKPVNVYKTGYNTSGSVLRRRVEQGQPNQALTLFAPVSMAKDLTKYS